MLSITRGNKVIFSIDVFDPDQGDILCDRLSEVIEASFLVKKNKGDLNAGAIVSKSADDSLGVIVNALKYTKISGISGLYVESTSYLGATSVDKNLKFNYINNTLQLGTGMEVSIGAGNRLLLRDIDGSSAVVFVKTTKLPVINASSTITMVNSLGSVIVRIDPDDTKNVNPGDYFFALQLKWDDDIQEVEFASNSLTIDMDIVKNN